MKKIEKEIKNSSAKLIESSLPEISSLDNLPTKVKKKDSPFLFILPLGLATLAIAALLIPTFLIKSNSGVISTSDSLDNSIIKASEVSYTNSSNYASNYDSTSTPPGGNKEHFYHYYLQDFNPTFNSFDEVAYCSYMMLAQEQTLGGTTKTLYKKNVYKTQNTDKRKGSFTDDYGRLHYPIDVEGEFVFSNFLFFEFDSKNSVFLNERIGNGHIYGLAVQTNIFDEQMIILKNGEKFYSCLTNGAGGYNHGRRAYIQFSAHKTIEGYDLVKDVNNKRAIYLYFGGQVEGQRDITNPVAIDIEGNEFRIPSESVFYDQTSVSCSLDDLAIRFGVDPINQVTDKYDKVDKLVYDVEQPETYEFVLEEFEGTFKVENDFLYLNNESILRTFGATKVYASDINKDGYREFVFECYASNQRKFIIYDFHNNNYLLDQFVHTLNSYYDYYIYMRDNRLTVGMYEPGTTDEEHMLDYGYFAYTFEKRIGFAWKNIYELSFFRVSNVFESDGITEVEAKNSIYYVNSNTTYIVELELTKYYIPTNDNYPGPEHPVTWEPIRISDKVPGDTVNWNLISQENGIYRYEISFDESGISLYHISFYRWTINLTFATDIEIE